MFIWNPFCHNRLNITPRKGELIFQLHIHPPRRTPPQNPTHFLPGPQLQQTLFFAQQHRTTLPLEGAPAVSQLPHGNPCQHRPTSEAPENRPIAQQPTGNPQPNRRDGISQEAERQPQQAEEPPEVTRLQRHHRDSSCCVELLRVTATTECLRQRIGRDHQVGIVIIEERQVILYYHEIISLFNYYSIF